MKAANDQIATVSDIVEDAIGERPTVVERVPTEEDSDVFRLHLATGPAFFKAEHEGHPIAVAAWAYERAGRAGVPVPDVLHVDASRERWPKEFVLIRAVAGTDLDSDPLEGAELVAAMQEYGALLRRLHSIATDGFGDLDFRDPSVADPTGEFADHASHVKAAWTGWGLPYVIDHGLVGPESVEDIRSILERHEEIVPAPERGVLLHDDPRLVHVFAERTPFRITGLIDFEPRSADPMWDLAIFAFHYPHLIDHLLDGYGAHPDDVEIRFELYGLIRSIGEARWEHEQDGSADRPLAEIARRTARLKALLS